MAKELESSFYQTDNNYNYLNRQNGLEWHRQETSNYDASLYTNYLDWISRYPLLTASQEKISFKAYKLGLDIRFIKNNRSFMSEVDEKNSDKFANLFQDSDSLEEMLTNANLKLVVYAVNRWYRFHIRSTFDVMDLIQEGNIGLVKAVRKFDYERGTRFSTYAAWWIKQSVDRASREKSRTIHIPIHIQERINRLNRMITFHNNSDNGLSTVLSNNQADNLNEKLGLTKSDIDTLVHVFTSGVAIAPVSLGLATTEDGSPLEEVIGLEDDQLSEIEEEDQQRTLSLKIAELLVSADLTPQERLAIQLRFGLLDGNERVLREVGDGLGGVTRERARQIVSKGLEKLRLKINSQDFKPDNL